MFAERVFENKIFSRTTLNHSDEFRYCSFINCTFKNLNYCFLSEQAFKYCCFDCCTFIVGTAEDAKALDKMVVWQKHCLRKPTILDLDGFLNKQVGMACPKTGSFCGYKKTRYVDEYDSCIRIAIVVLLIPEDAKRSSAFGRKCRCSKAMVVDIYDADTRKTLTRAWSLRDVLFTYRVGETVEVKDFDEDRWHECAPGIHFFMTEKEAKEYR